MKEVICEKYGVEYTDKMRHMSLNEFMSYMVDLGFELEGLAFNYYKWLGFSDRMAKVKVSEVLRGEQL